MIVRSRKREFIEHRSYISGCIFYIFILKLELLAPQKSAIDAGKMTSASKLSQTIYNFKYNLKVNFLRKFEKINSSYKNIIVLRKLLIISSTFLFKFNSH